MAGVGTSLYRGAHRDSRDPTPQPPGRGGAVPRPFKLGFQPYVIFFAKCCVHL